MTYCKVEDCRYPNTHTTLGHKCGLKGCSHFGHGQIEHYDEDMKDYLKQFHHEILPIQLQCTIINCSFPQHHITESHQCRMCKRFGHSIDTCIFKKLNNIDDYLLNNTSKQEIINFIEEKTDVIHKIYIRISSGYDDSLFIKKSNKGIITCFISDYWEQYQRNTEDYQFLLKFLNGFINKTDEFFEVPNIIKMCPICRIENSKNDIEEIFCDAECCVCLTNKVEICFKKCKHACVCKTCLKKLT